MKLCCELQLPCGQGSGYQPHVVICVCAVCSCAEAGIGHSQIRVIEGIESLYP